MLGKQASVTLLQLLLLEKQPLDCVCIDATERIYICAKPGHVTYRNPF